MTIRKTKYLLWFVVLVTIMACVPGGAAPIIPTIDPNAIATLIAQTANAAVTQTARAMPTLTHTATITPTRPTSTPEPTATATVIFRFSSPTAPVPPTTTLAAASNRAYSCQVMSVIPANGTTLAGRTDFDAIWRVRNNGQRNWNKDDVDYLFLDGDRIHTVESYDLPDTVRIGETVDLIVDMVAPKNSGTYTTNWTVRVDIRNFCTMSLTIVVQ
jgi:hypothetical protein